MFYRPAVRPWLRELRVNVIEGDTLSNAKRTRKRVTIKLDLGTFESLSTIRKRTGTPISTLMRKAVESYASFLPRRKPGRPRKLRGTR